MPAIRAIQDSLFVGLRIARCEELRKITSHPAEKKDPYFSATTLDADPPNELRTVMLSGYTGQDSEALNRPLPLFFSVPIRAPVAVT
jgi:hypothetical protein